MNLRLHHKPVIWLCLTVSIVGTAFALTTTRDRVDLIREYLLDAGRGGCLIVAHRGHHHLFPENSIESIQAAYEIGVHIAEVDLRRTVDGHYVLMHDADVKRTTNGRGPIARMTLSAAQSLQLMHATRPTAYRIPTYQDALRASRGKIMLNIDLKAGNIREVVKIARDLGLIELCLFKASYSKLGQKDANWLRSQKDITFMPIVSSLEQAKEAAKDNQFPAIEVVIKDGTRGGFDAKTIQEFNEAGVRIWVNTLWNGNLFAGLGDEQAVLKANYIYAKLARDGVGMIQTDLPELAISTIRGAGLLVP